LWNSRHAGTIADRPFTIARMHSIDELGHPSPGRDGRTRYAGSPNAMKLNFSSTHLPMRLAMLLVLTVSTTDFPRKLLVPVQVVSFAAIQDTFNETRGGQRKHEATDILAPRGTPVIATDAGVIEKLFLSKPGGVTIYQFDPTEQYCYYYAHLDCYRDGIYE